MSEKSGIEMLKELIRRMEAIEQRLMILDRSLNIVINKLTPNESVQKALREGGMYAKPLPSDFKPTSEDQDQKGFKNFKFQSNKKSEPSKASGVQNMTKGIMVSGKMVANSGDKPVPLPGISVRIFDIHDRVVKETKTNRAGHWMCKLLPGKYVALFEGEVGGNKLVPVNRNFEVPEKLPKGQDGIEVT